MTVQYTVQLGQSQFGEEEVGDDGTIRRGGRLMSGCGGNAQTSAARF